MAKKGVKTAAKHTSAEPQRRSTRRNLVAPVNVIKLKELVGGTRAAKAIDSSTTTIYNAIKPENYAINAVYEKAAAYALEHLGKPDGQTHSAPRIQAARRGEQTFIVIIASEKADTFMRVAESLGATVEAT